MMVRRAGRSGVYIGRRQRPSPLARGKRRVSRLTARARGAYYDILRDGIRAWLVLLYWRVYAAVASPEPPFAARFAQKPVSGAL